MLDIRAAVVAKMKERGWSVSRLLEESGLECDRSSLQRKLHGYFVGRERRRVYQGMTRGEARLLTKAVGLRVSIPVDESMRIAS